MNTQLVTRGHEHSVMKVRNIHSTEHARALARGRLPRLIFDFIDGAAGREVATAHNTARFDQLRLQPRAMADVGSRSISTHCLGKNYGVPFGIAPMGMCNLAWPKADKSIACAAKDLNMPVCLSSAGSSTLEDMLEWAQGRAWFQLYFNHSQAQSFAAVDRAAKAGYETLVLTVDVPEVTRRVKDQINGFNVPFRMTPRAFADFAFHPRWSLSTLANGIPQPRNFVTANTKFDRNASRAGADWDFLARLRDRWSGNLIVKGITSPEDAARVKTLGINAIYVSNHGGRQLDSAPAAIDILPLIRETVGAEYPLLFDSGIRNGEDVLKAFALGADFVMLGRPVLYALAAGGQAGLMDLLQCFAQDIDLAMAQIGIRDMREANKEILFQSARPKARADILTQTTQLKAAP